MRKLADASHLSVLKPEALLVPDYGSEASSEVLSREVSTSLSDSLQSVRSRTSSIKPEKSLGWCWGDLFLLRVCRFGTSRCEPR